MVRPIIFSGHGSDRPEPDQNLARIGLDVLFLGLLCILDMGLDMAFWLIGFNIRHGT